jgi:hypothetical protein
LSFARRETLELRRDPTRATLALLGSVILMLIMGYGISTDVENLTIMEIINNIIMLSIVLRGAALIREREHGTEHLLVRPVTPFEIMMSKVWAMGWWSCSPVPSRWSSSCGAFSPWPFKVPCRCSSWAPTTHFVEMAQAILFRGAGMDVVWPQFAALANLGAVFSG